MKDGNKSVHTFVRRVVVWLSILMIKSSKNKRNDEKRWKLIKVKKIKSINENIYLYLSDSLSHDQLNSYDKMIIFIKGGNE